jgi:hypothetical protein
MLLINFLREEKRRIEHEARIKYESIWLYKTGFNVGDTVKCNFPYEYVKSGKSYMGSRLYDGTIEIREDGTLCVVSSVRIPFTYTADNGRKFGSRREWQVEDTKQKEVGIDQVDLSKFDIEAQNDPN